MRQSPEIDLLLLCARPQLNDDALSRLAVLVQQELDWALIFHLAEQYRTTPLLALHLQRCASDLLSDDILAELQTYHRNCTRHNLVLAREVLRLIDRLSAEGVDVIAFKGPISAMLVYGDMSLRAAGDIDLLVRRTDHRKAEQLLEEEGYRVETRFENAMQSSLFHEQRQTSVDLHWGVPPENLRLRSAPLWEDRRPVTLLGRPVATFSTRDTLLVTAVNAVKEYWKPSIHHLTDIVALTSDYTDEAWLTAFRRAREIGCQRMLIAALLFAHRLLGMALPPVGPTRLFRHTGINKVVDELQDHLFLLPDEQTVQAAMGRLHHMRSQLYYLTLTDSPWRRARDWLKWAGTPNSADQTLVKLPKALAFLYFLIRPLRLLIKRL
jgi:hypothetical protein